MAEIQLGKGHIFALGSAALGCAAIASYGSPNLQNADVTHPAKVIEIHGQTGAVTGTIYVDDDEIEITFTAIPEGGSIAAAKIAASVPQRGKPFTATGFPIIQIGQFTDALNTNGANTQPFIYEGGVSLVGPSDEKWGVRLPLKRRLNIASGTAIS